MEQQHCPVEEMTRSMGCLCYGIGFHPQLPFPLSLEAACEIRWSMPVLQGSFVVAFRSTGLEIQKITIETKGSFEIPRAHTLRGPFGGSQRGRNLLRPFFLFILWSRVFASEMAKFKDYLQKRLLWTSPWERTVSVGKLEITFPLPDELSDS